MNAYEYDIERDDETFVKGFVEETSLSNAFRVIVGNHADVLIQDRTVLFIKVPDGGFVNWITQELSII